jgi:hypothetical protein
MSKPDTLSLSSSLERLEWRDGRLPDTTEADAGDADPFEIAKALRDSDPTAAYAVLERDGRWLVVSMPDEPPAAQKSEPVAGAKVWRTRFAVSARASEIVRAEFTIYGPSEVYLQKVARRLELVAPVVLHVTHDRISPVDFGDDEDGSSAGWEDDGANEIHMVEGVGSVVKYIRRVYPRNVPDNTELARALAKVFKDDEGAK